MNIKLAIENTLQKIDAFFKSKPKKDTNMIFVMIVAVSFAVAYPFYDLSLKEFNTTKEKVDAAIVKLNTDKAYLQANPQEKIAQLDMAIKKAQNDLEERIETNKYIKEKIMTISSLIYNEKAWGEYLDSISINALKHNIKINYFANKYVENNESFGHVLDIDLNVSGNYSDTMNFMNSLEQSELVVDLHDFKVKAQDKLGSKLNISVWGITYK